MDIWHSSLLTAAIAVLILRRQWRVTCWIIAATLSFIVTDYQKVFNQALVNGLADAMMCILIYIFGRYRWEMRLWLAWQVSCLISMLNFTGMVENQLAYVIGLECCNWLALVIMATQGLGDSRVDSSSSYTVFDSSNPVFEEVFKSHRLRNLQERSEGTPIRNRTKMEEIEAGKLAA